MSGEKGISLRQKLLLPVALLLCVFSLPLVLPCVLIKSEDLAFRIGFLCVIALTHVLILACVKWYSVRFWSYLYLRETGLEVRFRSRRKIHSYVIKNEELVAFHYLRLFSPKGWLTLPLSYVFPRGVWIVCCSPAGEYMTHIGYLDHKQLKQIAKQMGVGIRY